MDTWGAVDCFGVNVAGPAWKDGRLEDEIVEAWASSSSRWWRRAALVSTIPLNSRSRGGEGDAGRTLAIRRLLIADRDKLVVGALSWALRELAKRDPRAVWSFLYENEKALHPRVGREVSNKIRTGSKASGEPGVTQVRQG